MAATKLALQLGKGHKVVTILCDSGKYTGVMSYAELVYSLPTYSLESVGTRHLSKFWAKAGQIGGATDTTLDDVLDAGQR